MTAQAMEIIKIDGQNSRMATEPLRLYFEKSGKEQELVSTSSACWRGYVGTWEVKDDKLYLVDIEATISNHRTENYNTVGLDYFFPGKEEVFASWFSGEIRIPIGDLLRYVHMGYGSVFEEDLYLTIESGIIVSRITMKNRLKKNDSTWDIIKKKIFSFMECKESPF